MYYVGRLSSRSNADRCKVSARDRPAWHCPDRRSCYTHQRRFRTGASSPERLATQHWHITSSSAENTERGSRRGHSTARVSVNQRPRTRTPPTHRTDLTVISGPRRYTALPPLIPGGLSINGSSKPPPLCQAIKPRRGRLQASSQDRQAHHIRLLLLSVRHIFSHQKLSRVELSRSALAPTPPFVSIFPSLP